MDAERTARARVEALFAELDRLTSDDLAHIGMSAGDDAGREALRVQLAAAARAAGREALVAEARGAVRDAILRRYADGIYRPTWAGLNWGVSMGRVEDRAAVVAAIEDAVAVAALEDVLDPAVASELSLDGRHLFGLATGGPGEGALPARPWRRSEWVALLAFAAVAAAAAMAAGLQALTVAAAVIAVAVIARAFPRRPRDGSTDGPAPGRG